MANSKRKAGQDTRSATSKKRARIMELRESGKTFGQIADILTEEFGRSHTRQTVHAHFVKALEAVTVPAVEEYRETIIARNERIYSELSDIGAGDMVQDKDKIAALKACLTAQEQMIKVLGLAAPKQAEITVTPTSSKGEEVQQKLMDILARRKKNGEP